MTRGGSRARLADAGDGLTGAPSPGGRPSPGSGGRSEGKRAKHDLAGTASVKPAGFGGTWPERGSLHPGASDLKGAAGKGASSGKWAGSLSKSAARSCP